MAKQSQIFYKRMYPCVYTTVNRHGIQNSFISSMLYTTSVFSSTFVEEVIVDGHLGYWSNIEIKNGILLT